VEIEDTGHRSPTEGAARPELVAVAIGAAALCAVVVGISLSEAPPEERAVAAVAHGLAIATSAGVGLWALARHREDRFAWLLLACGALWSLTALASSHDATVYSLGRVVDWVAELSVVYLLVAFPSGRLTTRGSRMVLAAAVVVFALLWASTALLVTQYPLPNPATTCGPSCPHNALALTSTPPPVVDAVIRPVREVLTVLLFLGAVVVLARRARSGGPLLRRVLLPVVVIAGLRFVFYAVYFGVRSGQHDASALRAIGWIYEFLLPAVALAFGAGLIARSLYGTRVLQNLMVRLGADATAEEVRGGIAQALEDPTLRIVYWLPGDPGRWVDETGWPVRPPEVGNAAAVTVVGGPGRHRGAIVHDLAIGHDPALLRAAASYALVTLDNRQLIGELHATLDELSGSRERIAAVADEARRRIERDLHDGAQQRLIALRVRLALAAERIQASSPTSASMLEQLGGEVEQTIDEVRELARGIYPSVLSMEGLAEALREVAVGAALPTTVEAHGIRRYRPEIESAVYFACVEALQNVGKHARGATRASISLADNGRLRFEVRDDGAGMAPGGASGSGLTGLRDRLAAVGGEIEIESALGDGTHVVGTIPVP
jgi:signal transduction histidine kinase